MLSSAVEIADFELASNLMLYFVVSCGMWPAPHCTYGPGDFHKMGWAEANP